MAIEERIGFQVADAIANLNALNAAILQVNTSIRSLNAAGRGRGLANLQNGFNSVGSAAGRAGTGVNNAANAMQNANNVGTRAGQSLTLSWETFARVVTTQLIVRGINAIGDALSNAAERSAEFEIATARIANITDEGIEGVDGLRQAIRELAISTGRDLEEVTGAALEALQNDLGNTAETFELLRGPADDLAKATGVDLTSSINSLSSVLKAYNLDASESRDISDALFVAYDKGRVSLQQLESRLGTIIPQSAALGIEFQESAAAVASLTLSGLNAQTAMTQLRNIQAKLIKPTEELQQAFENLGVSTGSELIERFGGLQGALAALREEFDNDDKAVAKAFGTIRGQLGVLNLLANEGTNFTGVLEAMRERMGKVEEAADAVNATTTQQINEQYQLLLDNTIGVGNAINQLKLDTLTFVNNFIAGLTRLQQRQDFQKLATFASNFGTAFISVIDDIVEKLTQMFTFIGTNAGKAINLINRIINPVGASEETRISQITNDMQRLQATAAQTAQNIRQDFANRGDTSILGDQQATFDTLRNVEQQARITASNLRAQFLASEARIKANTQAANNFRASLQAATSAPLFGNTEALKAQNAELRGISQSLTDIQQRSQNATGAQRTQLQQELSLQRQKIEEKGRELGLDNKAIQALIGQAKATNQILLSQKNKAQNEQAAAEATEIANFALGQQIKIANDAGVSLKTLGINAKDASKAIANMPDPQVNAGPAIAQMNALRQAAEAAALAVANAGAGGGGNGFYHGGFIHRASGGATGRGQDTVPALLSPGEFVMNRRSSSRFFSQLQAMNAGQSPSFRESGGSVTNIGDTHVNVSVNGGDNPAQSARELASHLRRELRRKTSRLS